MERFFRSAALAVAITGLCGCAQQAHMVRPDAAQLQALEPLPVVGVIGQQALEAQNTFTAANVSIIPNPSVPILAGAVGGALGMAIVNAEVEAEAKRFAEAHVQPLRAALQDFDARGTLDESLRQGLARQPSMFARYSTASATPATGGARVIIESSYQMTADFSALQVIAQVSIQAPNAAGKPVYQNVLIYQSPRMTAPPKTAADSERMTAEENNRYSALDLDHAIVEANAALATHDVNANRMRQKITSEQLEHRMRLKQAKSPAWNPDTLAQRLCEQWAEHRGEALKGAMRASGAEIAHMLQLDLADQLPAGQDEQPRTVFKNETREIAYLRGGAMLSMASSDDGLVQNKPGPTVVVPMPSMRSH